MKLVLDTNSLFSDFYLRGATFTVIAHEVDAGNLEVTRVHAHEDDPGLLAWDPDICGCTRWG